MKSLALVAATAIAALPTQAQAQAQQPSAGSDYEQAVDARLSGDPAEAVRLLEPIVAEDPGNADAQVQLGYAYLALGEPANAVTAFTAALAVAPDYADARLGLARSARYRGDREAALQELDLLGPGNPEGEQLRRQIEADASFAPWALDFDFSYAAVEGPQPDWREGALQLRHQPTDQTAVAARLETSRRFGRTDIYLEARAEQAIGPRARVYVLLGGTPEADFRARWRAGAGGFVRVRDGQNATVLALDLRHAEFVTGDVQTATPGIEQYIFDGRAWLTARWINTFDDDGNHLSGYLFRGDVRLRDGLRVFAGYSNAPDTSEGVVVDTRSYFGGASVELSRRVTARFSAAFDESDTTADRKQVSLGLGWRF